MNQDMFQKIFNIIQDELPEEWKNVAFYAYYFEGSYQMKFFVKTGLFTYKDCYSVSELSDLEFAKLFQKIHRIINPERKKLKEKDKWTSMTMLVDNKGRMKTEFDYTDFSENVIDYEKAWKKKYL